VLGAGAPFVEDGAASVEGANNGTTASSFITSLTLGSPAKNFL